MFGYPFSLLRRSRSFIHSLNRRSTNTNTIQPNHYDLDHLPQSPNEIKYIVLGRYVDDMLVEHDVDDVDERFLF
jgi:hypothetical protein